MKTYEVEVLIHVRTFLTIQAESEEEAVKKVPHPKDIQDEAEEDDCYWMGQNVNQDKFEICSIEATGEVAEIPEG